MKKVTIRMMPSTADMHETYNFLEATFRLFLLLVEVIRALLGLLNPAAE